MTDKTRAICDAIYKTKKEKPRNSNGVIMHVTQMGVKPVVMRATWSAWVPNEKAASSLGMVLDEVEERFYKEFRKSLPEWIVEAIVKGFGGEIRPICHLAQDFTIIRQKSW